MQGIRPRNKEQYFALDALLDPTVVLVTIMGRREPGKTLLALAAGLEQVLARTTYRHLLISRPTFPMGKDIGYLPGSVEEKLNPLDAAHLRQPRAATGRPAGAERRANDRRPGPAGERWPSSP